MTCMPWCRSAQSPVSAALPSSGCEQQPSGLRAVGEHPPTYPTYLSGNYPSISSQWFQHGSPLFCHCSVSQAGSTPLCGSVLLSMAYLLGHLPWLRPNRIWHLLALQGYVCALTHKSQGIRMCKWGAVPRTALLFASGLPSPSYAWYGWVRTYPSAVFGCHIPTLHWPQQCNFSWRYDGDEGWAENTRPQFPEVLH